MTATPPIVEALIQIVALPYRRPVEWTTGGMEKEAQYLVVRLRDAEGRTAAAEAVCKPAWNGVSAAGLGRLFIDVGWPLLQAGARDGAALAAGVRGVGALSALLDTLCADFGYAGAEDFPVSPPIAATAVVTRADPERMRAEALAALAAGHGALKLKLGQGAAIDGALLRAARDAVGPGTVLSADANGAYAPAGLPALFESAAEAGLVFLEDPCPLPPLPESAALVEAAPVPVVADRFCESVLAARQFAGLGIVDLAAKPMRAGEATARAIAGIAAGAGGQGVVGLFGESAAGALVQLRLAATLPGPVRAVEAGFHETLADSYLLADPGVAGGFYVPPPTPHLASLIDWAKLARLASATHELGR